MYGASRLKALMKTAVINGELFTKAYTLQYI